MKLVSYCADMWTNMDDENDLTPFLSTILFTNASPSQTYSPLPLCCLRRVTRRRVSSCASLGATESRRSRRPPALGTHAHELGARGGAVLETGRYPLGTPIILCFPFCVVVVVVGCCYCCYCLLLLCSGGTASPRGPERTSQPSLASQAGPSVHGGEIMGRAISGLCRVGYISAQLGYAAQDVRIPHLDA